MTLTNLFLVLLAGMNGNSYNNTSENYGLGLEFSRRMPWGSTISITPWKKDEGRKNSIILVPLSAVDEQKDRRETSPRDKKFYFTPWQRVCYN